MANPGDIPSAMVLSDRVDSLVKTIAEMFELVKDLKAAVETMAGIVERQEARLCLLEGDLSTCRAINVLDAEIALIRDGMSQTALGGGE